MIKVELQHLDLPQVQQTQQTQQNQKERGTHNGIYCK
jgi:hypothetical protein